MKKNIYKYSEIPIKSDKEIFENIFENENVLIERIISSGQITPGGIWLEEDKDEWVLLIQGISRIEFENGEITELEKGDYISIPANTKHKVIFTSSVPNCIWLAIHIK